MLHFTVPNLTDGNDPSRPYYMGTHDKDKNVSHDECNSFVLHISLFMPWCMADVTEQVSVSPPCLWQLFASGPRPARLHGRAGRFFPDTPCSRPKIVRYQNTHISIFVTSQKRPRRIIPVASGLRGCQNRQNRQDFATRKIYNNQGLLPCRFYTAH